MRHNTDEYYGKGFNWSTGIQIDEPYACFVY